MGTHYEPSGEYRIENVFSFLAVASTVLSTACAKPSWGLFAQDYEDDFMSMGGRRREGGTIVDRLRDDKRFSKFVEVLERERGLRDDLGNRDKEMTVFAPTNEAFKHMEEGMHMCSGTKGKMDMKQIIMYHVAPDADIMSDMMHAGALIPTGLRLKSLGDRHQRMRVFKFHNEMWLNMHARIVDMDMEAENGRIHAIDRVVCPPMEVTEMMYILPTKFSTFLSGLERTGMMEKIESEKGMTIFAPSNHAWQNLGFDNLRYLFSCMGQKEEGGRRRYDERDGDRMRMRCKGMQDLKKIMEYHIGMDIAWSTDMMEKKDMRMETMMGEELEIKAMRMRRGGRDEDRDDDCDDHDSDDCRHRRRRDDRRRHDNDRHRHDDDRRRHDDDRRRHDDDRRRHNDDKKMHDVRKYNFIMNKGEARVSFTDMLGSNGAIQMIDNVMLPPGMRLPHDRMM
ncbi:FAS1 domain-containing protein [Fimicolochytrium jonesii]|uniref:FAS1 domain-containing protein n=1 Tax=Fimicolochytrium jonesii TaxID=1396493 RepID=UPI0022FF2B26|nr:FAS1 domain-containing protein [Fimicolochytrium jonesii]KAI8822459.1 FAS1 domain-containing protein [Fimicolochytrium jonesii]